MYIPLPYLIRYDLPFHLAYLSLSHTVMIYNYHLIRGWLARPDRRIVAFRVCVSLVSNPVVLLRTLIRFRFLCAIQDGSDDERLHRPLSSEDVLDSSDLSHDPNRRFRFRDLSERLETRRGSRISLSFSLSFSLSYDPDATISSARRSIWEYWNKSEGHGIM